MNLEEMKKLIQMVSESGVDRFEYKDDKFSVKIGKNETKVISGAVSAAPALQAAPQRVDVAEAKEPELEGTPVTAPLVGTFYEAPSEGADPFVKVGDKVEAGQVIGIVEAMKLMNEVESEVSGTVVAVVAKNGEMVEYGQPLILVK
ncbi:MAG: acetyl-CoA carboxylase biotin carboxyl carrier protein [Anaerostipes sp.]|nr:acetyl-CoA carboxylase biotin carboxyl carrier protein [Anaerostipes sp.]